MWESPATKISHFVSSRAVLVRNLGPFTEGAVVANATTGGVSYKTNDTPSVLVSTRTPPSEREARDGTNL